MQTHPGQYPPRNDYPSLNFPLEKGARDPLKGVGTPKGARDLPKRGPGPPKGVPGALWAPGTP